MKAKQCSHEGCIYPKWSKDYCKFHYHKLVKKPKPIRKITEKQEAKWDDRNKYYQDAIAANVKKNNGVCRCDECGAPIRCVKGRNVAHLIGNNANPAIYLDPRNHFILCWAHLEQFDNKGEQAQMKIWPLIEERKQDLNLEYCQGI